MEDMKPYGWCLTVAGALVGGSFGATAVAQQVAAPLIAGVQVQAEQRTLVIEGLNLGSSAPRVSLALSPLTVVPPTTPTRVVAVLPPLPPGTYLLGLERGDRATAVFYLTLGAFSVPAPVGAAPRDDGQAGARSEQWSSGRSGGGDGRLGAAGGFQPRGSEQRPGGHAVPRPCARRLYSPYERHRDRCQNTEYGEHALAAVTTGTGNTAVGWSALRGATSGASNSAVGREALAALTTGSFNTAVGQRALFGLTAGSGNTGSGSGALRALTAGNGNAALGHASLRWLTAGSFNTAFGQRALFSLATGSGNIAVGREAGFDNTGGSDNIYIGARGIAGESNVIRIGTASTHTATHLSGTVTAPAFVGDGSGLTGVVAVYQ